VEEWDYLGCPVAIKRYKSDTSKSIDREFGVLTRVHFPHLPRLLGWTSLDEQPCIVLERYSSSTLEDVLESRPVPFDEKERWAMQVWSALRYLHSRKPTLAHGDVHPRNVLFTVEPHDNLGRVNVILCDFDFSVNEGWMPDQLQKLSLFPRFANREVLRKEDHCALDLVLFGFFIVMVRISSTAMEDSADSFLLVEEQYGLELSESTGSIEGVSFT